METKQLTALRQALLFVDLARDALAEAVREAARSQRTRRRRKR